METTGHTKRQRPFAPDLVASLLTASVLVWSAAVESHGGRVLTVLGVLCLAAAPPLWILPVGQLRGFGLSPAGRPYYEATVVVRQGIYALVRHPQYLAYMLLNAGFAFLRAQVGIGLLALAAIALFYLQAVWEERALVTRFGDAYVSYRAEVPRFNLLRGVMRKLWKRDRPAP